MIRKLQYLVEQSSILVVDDTIDTLKIIGELLKKEFAIKVATNGETALKIAQSNTPPDLILLDVMLPDINGYEVCKILKKNSATADIPVIFLTSKNEIEDEARGLGVGAVDYIVKPVYPAILTARVKTHLLMKKMHDLLVLHQHI